MIFFSKIQLNRQKHQNINRFPNGIKYQIFRIHSNRKIGLSRDWDLPNFQLGINQLINHQ